MSNASRTVLLLGNYRPALTVARQLAAQGYRIIVTRDANAGAAGRSRAVSEIWDTPPDDFPAALYSALATFLAARPDIGIVFPLMESYVRSFYDHAETLPQDRLYVMPTRSAVEVCLDKARLLHTVIDAGLPCAENIPARDIASLRAAAGNIGYPLIVKPADSTIWLGTRKAVILHDQAGFDAAFPVWPDEHAELIVQIYIDGPRLNLYFAARNGRAIRYLAAEIGQTDIADGTGLATDGVTIPVDETLRALGDTLLARLDYHGVGCIQVLRDRASGHISFLELNPRIGGNHAITAHCGLGLEALALALAAGEPVDGNLQLAPAGKRYVWTTGALRGTGAALRSGEVGAGVAASAVGRALWNGVTCRHHVTFTLRDPLPTLALLARLAPGLRKIVR